MEIRKYFLSIFSLIILFSCNNNDDNEIEKTLIIASQKVDCVGVDPQKCLLIKTDENQQNWEYLYSSIAKFNYIEGFEYSILVSEKQIKNPPQDASSIAYCLVEVISKTEKTSTNLPN